MSKCDGCFERVAEGKKPVCVDSCPQRALDFDEIQVLRERYGQQNAIAPLPNPSMTKPNLVVKAHADSRPTGDSTGAVLNPEEI